MRAKGLSSKVTSVPAALPTIMIQRRAGFRSFVVINIAEPHTRLYKEASEQVLPSYPFLFKLHYTVMTFNLSFSEEQIGFAIEDYPNFIIVPNTIQGERI